MSSILTTKLLCLVLYFVLFKKSHYVQPTIKEWKAIHHLFEEAVSTEVIWNSILLGEKWDICLFFPFINSIYLYHYELIYFTNNLWIVIKYYTINFVILTIGRFFSWLLCPFDIPYYCVSCLI